MHIEAAPRRKHGISLTPLIDVVFILLLFFMLATNFTDWREISLATGTTTAETAQPTPAIVHVDADGTLRYADRILGVAELAQLLKQQQAEQTIEAVVVKPAPATTLGATVSALDALAATGLPVALARTNSSADTQHGSAATP